ncbi:MAG: peptide chain release factor N(5)-glutamine methyltransferase [Gallionella sp.]|nr:peptide chain release factor N(5)-glutamine methyltransferase [Gallionella sp.]
MDGKTIDSVDHCSGQTLNELQKLHSKQLQAALNIDFSTASIEVRCLLQAVLQVNHAYLISHPAYQLSGEQYANFSASVQRRLSGEPIAYILGEREFFGLNFVVSPATLIPRPETELLVELALQRIPSQGACRVLDMGVGSGAIALSLARERPNIRVVAVDASEAALEIARLNMLQHDLKNVKLLHSDWFTGLRGERFDVIVSNPPYIAAGDAHLTHGDLRFEPHTALVSGTDGLDDVRRICAQAKSHLNASGYLLLEHGYNQAESVRALLRQSGFSDEFSAKDIAEIERVSGGKI